MFKKKKQQTEIVRIVLENDKQKFFLKPDVWEDPAAWGLLLVDLLKHIANSYSQSYNLDKEDVLRRIREGFDIEWESPTEEELSEPETR